MYASLYPHAGVAVNPDTGEAIKPEQQGLLDQSREEEGEVGLGERRGGLAPESGPGGLQGRLAAWNQDPFDGTGGD